MNCYKIIKPFIVILSIVLIFSICIGFFIYSNIQNVRRLEEIPYRTDIQPLKERFGEIIDIEKCFWKADLFNKIGIGPSSYWMQGFILISPENAENIKSQYSLSSVDINFEDGMTPDIIKKSEYKWSYNKELSRKIAGVGFIGEFYFDVENNIFYFDLESN